MREYLKGWSFPTRWGRSPPERGRILSAYKRRRWVRERKGFWAELRKRLGGEREEFEFYFERAGCFHAGADIF
jgi:hypothetical protein